MFAKKVICENCGSMGYPKLKVKGSLLTEIILWMLFLIPGIIYSIWRHSTAQNICKTCKSISIIPLDSPKGKRMMESFINQISTK